MATALHLPDSTGRLLPLIYLLRQRRPHGEGLRSRHAGMRWFTGNRFPPAVECEFPRSWQAMPCCYVVQAVEREIPLLLLTHSRVDLFSPLAVLRVAHRANKSEGVYGSSTICILTINTLTGSLNSANLGDSGYVVIGPDDRRPELLPAKELLPPEESLDAAGTVHLARKVE